MNTPERLSALRGAKQTLRMRDQRIIRMEQRLKALSLEHGVQIDKDTAEEITKVIEEESSVMADLPKSDFRRIFWNQQIL
jgi:hypothetical protein